MNATWSAYFDVHANHYILRVRGPEATCSTGGEYQIGFRDTKKSTKYDTTLHISVKSMIHYLRLFSICNLFILMQPRE
jgi:hypothetical protein